MQQTDKDRLYGATSSTLRALSGNRRAQADMAAIAPALTPGGQRLRHVRDNHGTTTPHMRVPEVQEAKDIPAHRGSADSAALFLRHHDAATHAENRPAGGAQAALYDVMEQMRCDALGAKNMAGVRANLRAAMEDYCIKQGYGNPNKAVAVPVHDALGLLAAEEFGLGPLPETANIAAGEWRDWLARRNLDWDGLKDALSDQAAFSELSRSLIEKIQTSIPKDGNEAAPADAEQNQQPDTPNMHEGEDAENDGQTQSLIQGDSADGDNTQEQSIQGGTDMEEDAPGAEGQAPQEGQPKTTITVREDAYHVYTKEYDEQVDASKLATQEELQRLRALLDGQLEPYQTLIARMANRLQRLLLAKQQRAWEFDVEDGWLDTKRLARMIANPTVPTSYKREKETDFRDSCITLLIDNSGSMRGRPIAIAALTTDILARTLEQCGLKVEILGFTTGAWKGGQARQQWMAADRPPAPGRLNDLRHIIYKGADMPMRRARLNLGLMLKEGLLKENIDGEALQWAAKRLLKRPEERKILMVISDGAPVDDSTLSANASDILETHLKQVVTGLEADPHMTLMAIGIGHDVSRYYTRAMTIRDSADLGEVMIEELSSLFQ